VDARTLNLDPGAVEAAITERTKGIVAVDMFGYPCELDELRAIAERRGLWIIDDSCEALGAEYKGRPVGSHGIAGAFGFYPNKQITTGEGGIVTTHSEEEWELLKSLRNHGRSYESRWFHHVRVGFNYRFTDLQAAMGIAQLEKLDEILRLRAEAADRYGALLADVDGVEAPAADDADHRRSWFVYVTKLARELDRETVMARLGDEGIEAAHYVPCVHLQPYMRERYGFREGMCPIAEDASEHSLALPFFTGIEAGDQEQVVEALSRAVGS
jgi:perosamine synthetase